MEVSLTRSTIESNITDTALIFEGGAMRSSYTSAVVNLLLQEEIYFDYVAGTSSGSTMLVNYLTRDQRRSKRSFIDIVQDAKMVSWRRFFTGQGIYDAEGIYGSRTQPDGLLPFNYGFLRANPAQYRIGTFSETTGETVYLRNEDLDEKWKVSAAVRASSALPVLMPPVRLGENLYFDGGIGASAGLAIDVAKADGFKKFFIVLSRDYDYHKVPYKTPEFFKVALRDRPAALEGVLSRWYRYNRVRDEIKQLESEGKAYVFWPENMLVRAMERNTAKLRMNYQLGMEQALRELPRWREFLGLDVPQKVSARTRVEA